MDETAQPGGADPGDNGGDEFSGPPQRDDWGRADGRWSGRRAVAGAADRAASRWRRHATDQAVDPTGEPGSGEETSPQHPRTGMSAVPRQAPGPGGGRAAAERAHPNEGRGRASVPLRTAEPLAHLTPVQLQRQHAVQPDERGRDRARSSHRDAPNDARDDAPGGWRGAEGQEAGPDAGWEVPASAPPVEPDRSRSTGPVPATDPAAGTAFGDDPLGLGDLDYDDLDDEPPEWGNDSIRPDPDRGGVPRFGYEPVVADVPGADGPGRDTVDQDPPSAGIPVPSDALDVELDRDPETGCGALPQRVPAAPDPPTEPGSEPMELPARTPELTRIASHLRRDDVPPQRGRRPEGFDVEAVLAAVRGVPGVRDASLRTSPGGAHSLRLDLADRADPAMVSRDVARLLEERMGLWAEPRHPQPEWPPGSTRSGTMAGPAGHPTAPERADGGDLDPDVAHRHRSMRGRAQREPRFAGQVSGGADDAPPDAGERDGAVAGARSRPLASGAVPGPRVIIDHVQVSTFGLDATVEVRLGGPDRPPAVGVASGPAVDGYVLRLCAAAAAAAIDELMRARPTAERGRCFVEHAAVVPFGSCDAAVVVVLLAFGGWVEQLVGSALVAGDPRQAVVRATLAAVNRRLEALLA